MIAAGYAGLAALLLRLAHGRRSLGELRGVTVFLVATSACVLVLGSAVAAVLAAMRGAAEGPPLLPVLHFWIGDATGSSGSSRYF